MEIDEIGYIDHFYTPYTSNPSAHHVAGQLSWLERGIHKPEVGSSILLPATKLKVDFVRIMSGFIQQKYSFSATYLVYHLHKYWLGFQKINLISIAKPRIHLFSSKVYEGVLQIIWHNTTSDPNQLNDHPLRFNHVF